MNENSDNPLFQPHVSGWRVPDAGQISRKTQQNFLVGHRHGLDGSIEFLQIYFELVGLSQLSVPPSLQLCRNETVVRIDSFVSPRCQMGLVSSLLHFQFKRFPLLPSLAADLLGCFQRRLHSVPTDRTQYFTRHCFIGPKAPERNTPVFSMIHMRTLAVIPKYGSLDTCIGDVEHSNRIVGSEAFRKASKARPPRPAFGSMRDFMCALLAMSAWLRSYCSHEM
ncbi:MAG: hypothetical protein ABIZ80_22210 [Bryobacteraceae bacterium]